MSNQYNQDYYDDPINPDEMVGHTPEQIAQELFNKDPEPPLSQNMFVDPDSVSSLYIHEILLTIFLEALHIFTGGIQTADLSGLSRMYIQALNPWFHSLGFQINVSLDDAVDNQEDSIRDRYSKIVINRGQDTTLFDINNVSELPYQFLVNGGSLRENEMKDAVKDLYSVFIHEDRIFKISFDFYIPATRPNTTLL